MFDIEQIRRDDMLLALGTALGLAGSTFVTSFQDGLLRATLSAGFIAVVAVLVTLLFAALD